MANDDIQGQVTDQDENAVPNATVALWSQSNPTEVITTQADANGFYEFTGHPDDDGTTQEWHLAARDPNDDSRQFPSLHSISSQMSPVIPDSVVDNAYGWYDASEITANDQDSITGWADKSGLNNDLSGSAVYNASQVNGEPAVFFDGGDDLMTTPDSTGYPITWFVVHRTDADTGENEQGIVGNGGSVANIDTFQHDTVDDQWEGRFSANAASGGAADQNWHVSTFKNDGSSGFIRVDSTQVLSASVGTNDTPESITIGDKKDATDRPFLGYVSEAIFVSADVSASDIQTTEEQLADTYGISLA